MKRYWFIIFSIILALNLRAQPVLQVTPYSSGFTKPVNITHAGDSRLFIVEQRGIIKIIDGSGTVLPTPFLDIRDRVNDAGNEQGLLGLAFDPGYDTSGEFYVNYTGGNGSGFTRISRFRVDPANPDSAVAASEEILIVFNQPFSNHNGGDMHFGQDNYLYIATGDGGSAGDPQNNAQNTNSWLGKILRIDVNGDSLYSIPPDNPFAGQANVKQEIWSYGVRNPWRFSFDRGTGDMWIADVGQNNIEEVNFEPAGSAGGTNYGWRCYEGNDPYNQAGCNGTYTFPIFTYPHNINTGGFSITGGYVYRGDDYTEMLGDYIVGDYISGNFWIISQNDTTGAWEAFRQNSVRTSLSTFGENHEGELFCGVLSNGTIYKVSGDCPDKSISVSISLVNDTLKSDRPYGQYIWFRNGIRIPGATGSFYVPLEEGAYRAFVTVNEMGCRYFATSNQVDVACVLPACIPTITLTQDTLFSACAAGEKTWMLDGVPIEAAGTDSDFWVPVESGTYSLAVYDSIAAYCIKQDTSNSIVVTISAVLDRESRKVSLYPNPASESVQFSLPIPVNGITAFDAAGREFAVLYQSDGNTVKVSTVNLARGSYFLKVITDEGSYAGRFQKE